jgi:tetratricopeptide (TPR) repeat protein
MKLRALYAICLALLALCACVDHAYAAEPVDSLFKEARLNVYRNPGNAFEVGLALYESPNASPERRMDGLVLVITALNSLRDYESAGNYVQKAISLLDEITAVNTKIAVLNQLGYINQQLRLYDEALKHLDAALELCKQQPMTEVVYAQIGFNHAARGFIYKEQMNCSIALNSFAEAMNYLKKSGATNSVKANLSIVAYNRGNCLLLLLEHTKALSAFEVSLAYADSIDGQSLLAFAKKGMAEVYTAKGNYNTAIQLLHEAATNAEGIGDLVLNMGIEKGLANNYLALSEWNNYSEHRMKSELLQAQLLSAERKSIANVLALNHAEYIKSSNQERSAANFVYMLFSFGALGLLLSFYIYLRKLRTHSKALKGRIKLLERAPLVSE